METPMKILIVDDDVISRRILSAICREFGDVDVACDGKEALAVFDAATKDEDPYELILLDIIMPVMDGEEVLRRIREIETEIGIFGKKKCRIVMSTSLKDKDHIMGSFREGCDGYIVKPFSKDGVIHDLKKQGIISA